MGFLIRILQVFLVLTLAVAAVLWFAARRGDRGTIQEEVNIARSPAAVFRWISSEDLVHRWLSGLIEFKRVDSSSGRVPDFRLVEMINGQRTAMSVKIIRVIPNQELGLQVNSLDNPGGGFASEADFKFIGDGDYTRLIFHSQTQFLSTRDRILEPIWTTAAKHKMADDLAKLKNAMEAEPANSPNLRATSSKSE